MNHNRPSKVCCTLTAWHTMKDFDTPQHEALRKLLKEKRQRAELTQVELAERIGRAQSFMSAIEPGRHRVSVVEFLCHSGAGV
jgi:transcriptional regulator with XRE-family HTH domain